MYVEYESGERELYNLANDPYELDNIYASADPDLVALLGALRGCSGRNVARRRAASLSPVEVLDDAAQVLGDLACGRAVDGYAAAVGVRDSSTVADTCILR